MPRSGWLACRAAASADAPLDLCVASQKTLEEERSIRDVQRKDLVRTRETLAGALPLPAYPRALCSLTSAWP